MTNIIRHLSPILRAVDWVRYFTTINVTTEISNSQFPERIIPRKYNNIRRYIKLRAWIFREIMTPKFMSSAVMCEYSDIECNFDNFT
jgi:hypothetical protein